jgi:hypothetical protein
VLRRIGKYEIEGELGRPPRGGVDIDGAGARGRRRPSWISTAWRRARSWAGKRSVAASTTELRNHCWLCRGWLCTPTGSVW